MAKVEVFLNPSRGKVPRRLKYKAIMGSGPVIGVGYGATKEAAKRKARADFNRKFH